MSDMQEARRLKREAYQKTADSLNDTSFECFVALDEIRIMDLEDENAKLMKEREEIKEGIDEAMRDIELSSTRNAMSTLRALLAKLEDKG